MNIFCLTPVDDNRPDVQGQCHIFPPEIAERRHVHVNLLLMLMFESAAFYFDFDIPFSSRCHLLHGFSSLQFRLPFAQHSNLFQLSFVS